MSDDALIGFPDDEELVIDLYGDEEDAPVLGIAPQDGRDCVDSPFVILVDSYEQLPYKFENIIGDYRQDYKPILVRTRRKRLPTGDYAIENCPGILIERKSKEDLFQSVRNGQKRENFLGRLRRMQDTLKYGSVIVECNSDDLYLNPPEWCDVSPKSVYRTILAWSQAYPLVHWHFCADRDFAEQTCYRILEKFFVHESIEKYQHHNKVMDDSLEAFRLGFLARRAVNEAEIPHPEGSYLRTSWLRGWGFASTHYMGGDSGKLVEIGQLDVPPPSPIPTASAVGGRKLRVRRKKAGPEATLPFG
jgi:hypothetical protein